MRSRFGNRHRAFGASPLPSHEPEVIVLDEDDLDVPLEELQEFLAADLFEVPADPTFKEGLREKLWELIESGAFGYGRTRGH